ncbi:MAG: NDP-sugar synthase [Chloroflexota bacterium]
MKAVILVGGEGTRLRPLSYILPKAMMPVLGKPFLEHLISRLRAHRVDEIVLALSYKAQLLMDHFGDGSRLGVRLHYCLEDPPLGTAGAVKNAAQYLDGPIFVLNGDIFTDLDFSAMLEFHRARKSEVTIALTPVEDPSAFGVVETDAAGRVVGFVEKPPSGQVKTNMINAGVYIVEPEIVGLVPDRCFYMFEHSLFPRCISDSRPFFAYPMNDYWIDMGTVERYRQLNCDLLRGRSRQVAGYPGMHLGKDCVLDPRARLEEPLFMAEGCVVESRAELRGPVVMGRSCRIGSGAVLEGTVLWSDVQVGEMAIVRDCTVAAGCRIGDGVEVEGKTIIQDYLGR